jgi:peptidoglycan/LPS O-acetylase OafA/YrhL
MTQCNAPIVSEVETRKRSDNQEYRPAIDGLRAIAVLSVFVFHLSHEWLPGGFLGVDVFFVISGYLITSLILRDSVRGSFSLIRFYQRRIARIFPAFFTVALATLACAYAIYTQYDLASAGANLVAAALSVANIKFMLQGNYFTMSADAQPFLHYWSLSVEEQFYLVFPFLFMAIFKYFRRHLVVIFAVLAVSSFVLCTALTAIKPTWAFYLLPTRAWELLAGSLLAIGTNGAANATPGPHWWRSVLAVLGIATIGLSFVIVHDGPHFPGVWALMPVVGTAAVLMPSAYDAPVEKCLRVVPMVFIGRMSYSLYLWHWPVISFVDYQLYSCCSTTRLSLKIGLSFGLAAVSFFLIEGPARSYLSQRSNRSFAYLATICMSTISVFLGYHLHKTYHVAASDRDVASGGLVFSTRAKPACSVVLTRLAPQPQV